jgi:cysteine desulfurase
MGNHSSINIYLDYGATTPVRAEVLEVMIPYLRDQFGNPSSPYLMGLEAKEAIEKARSEIAHLIGARADEIIFTSGATEANNLAIQGISFANIHKGNHIITSSIEHLSVLNTCRFLERQGFQVTYVRVDRHGRVEPDEIKKKITPKTILISIMHANNEIGTIQPIKEISKIAQERQIIFHTDAAQTIGKAEINVNELGVDALSFSAHKIYGPKGVGALFLKKGINIRPIIFGGDQERGFRAGTENVAAIVGMAQALRLIKTELQKEVERESLLAKTLLEGIIKKIDGVFLNGDPLLRVPGNLHFSFSGLDGQKLAEFLDEKGIQVSTGSACSSLHNHPSHVLEALGLADDLAIGSIRINIGLYTKSEDIEYVLKVFPEAVEKCRKIGVDLRKKETILREKVLEAYQTGRGCASVKKLAWAYFINKLIKRK